jgi:hypothetical protein
MFKHVANFLRKRKNSQSALSSSLARVSFIRNGEEKESFLWDQVIRIETYKDDLYTTDLICLEFELENGCVYLAHEESPGFVELTENMNRVFSNLDSDWFVTVMAPAFKRNQRVLYEKNA